MVELFLNGGTPYDPLTKEDVITLEVTKNECRHVISLLLWKPF
jgi:hypothetical protein